MTAARWLIDFVGIRRVKHDWRIDAMGAPLFPLDDPKAHKLVDVWLGCTKATSHPTDGSDHPSVDPPELDSAIRIVGEYLDPALYGANGRTVAAKR
jgi:hypothetical protein